MWVGLQADNTGRFIDRRAMILAKVRRRVAIRPYPAAKNCSTSPHGGRAWQVMPYAWMFPPPLGRETLDDIPIPENMTRPRRIDA